MPRKATPLTDAECKKATPKEKPYKLTDGAGLFLAVSATGNRVWRGSYIDQGKPQTATYGPYPTLSLKDARVMHQDTRRKLLKGEVVKKVVAWAPVVVQPTLSKTIEVYLEAREKDASQKYLQNCRFAMNAYIEPDLGKFQLDSVERKQLLGCLMKINDAGRTAYARKIRMWVDNIYEWALHHEMCKTNPAHMINPRIAFNQHKVKHFPSLKLLEVPAFLRRLNQEPDYQDVLACKLLALTWVRTDELRCMTWAEIEGDVWRVPGTRMKEELEHIVPLPRQALDLLRTLKTRCAGSEYVFPGLRKPRNPMNANVILRKIHGIGYKGKMSGHGWRSVASTWANEREYNRDHIEVALAHIEGDVRAVYNSAMYMSQRRAMLQAYADWLDEATLSPAET